MKPIHDMTDLVVGSFLIVIMIAIVAAGFGIASLFQDSKTNFVDAKENNQTIVCTGLVGTYVVAPKDYEVFEDYIQIDHMFMKKMFKMDKCNIEENQ